MKLYIANCWKCGNCEASPCFLFKLHCSLMIYVRAHHCQCPDSVCKDSAPFFDLNQLSMNELILLLNMTWIINVVHSQVPFLSYFALSTHSPLTVTASSAAIFMTNSTFHYSCMLCFWPLVGASVSCAFNIINYYINDFNLEYIATLILVN